MSFPVIEAAAAVALVLAVIIVLLVRGNNRLTVSSYRMYSRRVTKPVKIVQLSDLHNKQFGAENRRLEALIMEQRPDLIVFTGDLEDRRQRYQKASALFLARMAKSVPVLFVYGNQEMLLGSRRELNHDLKNGGVIVLDEETARVTVQGQALTVLGLNDCWERGKRLHSKRCRILLKDFQKEPGFRLLLTHYPQYFGSHRRGCHYGDYEIDLVMAGHAHGGLIRIPWIGGVIAPGQGLFPRYTSGFYRSRSATMVVSRGLGNSGLPFRINNPPDVVALTVMPQK